MVLVLREAQKFRGTVKKSYLTFASKHNESITHPVQQQHKVNEFIITINAPLLSPFDRSRMVGFNRLMHHGAFRIVPASEAK